MDLNGVAAIITATGGALATVITQLLTWKNQQTKMREQAERLDEQTKEMAALKEDHQRIARDLGRATRDLQDTVGTIDDRTQSTQRIAEGLAFAASSGNTPIPAIRAQPPPRIEPIPTGSQPGYKR